MSVVVDVRLVVATGVLPYEVANVLARLVFDGALTGDGVSLARPLPGTTSPT